MEENACKIIIEFNGLPGCGKSTIAKELLKRLGTDKATVPYNIPGGKIRKLLKTCFDGSIPFILNCFFILKEFNSSTFSEKKYFFLTAYGHFRLYLHFLSHSEKMYLVVDQGLFQDIISFAFLDRIRNEKYVTKLIRFCLKKFTRSLLVVNCSIDTETSLQRISQRGKTDGSRLDKIYRESPSKAKEILEIQQRNLGLIREVLAAEGGGVAVSVDCNTDVCYNSDLIEYGLSSFSRECN